MKAIILDGSLENDRSGQRVRAALTAELRSQDWDVEAFTLCEQKIGACAGDFFCWIRTPGICNVNDDNRAIAQSLAGCDLMVYLTPITFGGYSSTLKRMVDHQIQNVSPFFAMVEGETHHRKRYKKNPDLLAVGWMDTPDPQAEAVFRHLVQRNGINWHCETWVGDVVLAGQPDEALRRSAQRWLADIRRGRSSRPVELPASSVIEKGVPEIQHALLLVGSPKTRKSTSNSLGGYLFETLSKRSIQTETIYPHTVYRSAKKMQALFDAVDKADVILLAFPIYVDTLPAPIIEAFERIAEHRKGRDRGKRRLFAAIANCGFPEAYQTATGLANCRMFAQAAGFEWAGSLALGAGEMINGANLVEAGGMTIRIRRALELAAEALAQGQAIPEEAREMMAKPVIPHWLYRLTGWMRWNRWAKNNGAKKLLKQQPYLANGV